VAPAKEAAGDSGAERSGDSCDEDLAHRRTVPRRTPFGSIE